MEKKNSVLVVLFSFLITSAAYASNRIVNIDLPMSGIEVYTWCPTPDNPGPQVPLLVNDGETIRLLLKIPDDPNLTDGPIHLINKAVGQVRATSTDGYEYIGSVMFQYYVGQDLPFPTPYPNSDIVNLENGRGAGVFLLHAEWVAPAFPELGVSIVKGLIVVVFQDGLFANPKIAHFYPFMHECKGLGLN